MSGNRKVPREPSELLTDRFFIESAGIGMVGDSVGNLEEPALQSAITVSGLGDKARKTHGLESCVLTCRAPQGSRVEPTVADCLQVQSGVQDDHTNRAWATHEPLNGIPAKLPCKHCRHLGLIDPEGLRRHRLSQTALPDDFEAQLREVQRVADIVLNRRRERPQVG